MVLCGVDTLAIQSPEIDELRRPHRRRDGRGLRRHPAQLRATPTTRRPAASACTAASASGSRSPTRRRWRTSSACTTRIVEVCRLACERLEPAWVRWGLGSADDGINRRERDPDGMVRRHRLARGGHARPVAFPCSRRCARTRQRHRDARRRTAAHGDHERRCARLLARLSGPAARRGARRWTGGECVFFSGAAGNVMPRVSFDDASDGDAADGRGHRARGGARASSDRPAWPRALASTGFGFRSGSPSPPIAGAPARRRRRRSRPSSARSSFPLLPLPSLEEIVELRERAEAEIARGARPRGATEPELRLLRFHGLNWARRAEAELAGGNPRRRCAGRVERGAHRRRRDRRPVRARSSPRSGSR